MKQEREALKRCIESHKDALRESEIRDAQTLIHQRDWILSILTCANNFMTVVNDNLLNIVDTSEDRKQRLDEAMSRNAEIER